MLAPCRDRQTPLAARTALVGLAARLVRFVPNSRQVLIQMIVYFVTRCLVGATVLSGGVGEIANVNHVFQPDGRFAASNSP